MELFLADVKERRCSLLRASILGVVSAFGIYHVFFGLEHNILRSSITILALGLFIFYVLWVFRTHDVQRQIDKTEENTNNHSKDRNNDARFKNGKMKAMSISDTTKPTIHKLVRDNIVSGSTIYTDDSPSYVGSYRRHKAVNHSAKQYVNGMAHTNRIESVWAVLKRGLAGTYHHVSVKHLPRYIDEFSFRLNEGNCNVDTIDRMEALVKGFDDKRLTYKNLID